MKIKIRLQYHITFLLLSIILLSSCKYKVTATDSKGQPLEGVTVKLYKFSLGGYEVCKTKKNGKSSFRAFRLPEFEYLTAEKHGYESDYLQGHLKRFDFILRKSNIMAEK